MLRPSNQKGEVVIKTKIGDVAADKRNFSKPIEELMLSEEWKEAVGLRGGSLCYVESELDIPF